MKPLLTSIRISVRPKKRAYVPLQHGEFLRAVVYKVMGDLWRDIHDSSLPKPFAINPIRFPRGIKIENKTFIIHPHEHGYFDVVIFGEDQEEAVRRFRAQERKTIDIGRGQFKVVSTNIKVLTQKFLEKVWQPSTVIEMTLKTPLVFIGDGYGTELKIHEITLAHLLKKPLEVLNSISRSRIDYEEMKRVTKGIVLDQRNSTLTTLRFPLHNDGKQTIFTGHKGHLTFRGEITSPVAVLTSLANWVNIGYGRTIGLGKVYTRVI